MIKFKITSVVKKGHRPSGRLILETDDIEGFEELIEELGVQDSLRRDEIELFISASFQTFVDLFNHI